MGLQSLNGIERNLKVSGWWRINWRSWCKKRVLQMVISCSNM